MNATVIGSQFGDEGKGGIVDLFGRDADVVARFQGGANAGHTVVHRGEEYALRLVPSGVLRGATGVLGNGCVVDPAVLFDELDRLRDRGLEPDVRVADRAHVVLPYHRALDRAAEDSRGEAAVGTTGNGIGPAYEDKAGRRGIRVADLLEPDALRSRLERVLERTRTLAEEAYGVTGVDADDAFDVERLLETCRAYGDRLEAEGMVVDSGRFLERADREGRTILFEGAQGTHLDVDHGTYPFVTSSTPTAGGAIAGTGVAPSTVADGNVVGVVKAYLTRVGSGPMPTEFDRETAARVREAVGGFGTVTGRPRRIGWLDLPLLRYAARVNGVTGLAINHVDALAGFDELRVCDAYEFEGETLTEPPSTAAAWERCAPRYETLPTWADRDWREVAETGYDALPENARRYVEYVRDRLERPVVAVSVGPGREETIVRRNPFEPLE